MAMPWPAPAKLNLFLHITGRRADGYHELQTIFQFLDHGDRLWFSPRNDGIVARRTDVPGIPAEEDLIVRAALALRAVGGERLGVDIDVEKRIPLGGGLGGGSSDAATTLVALNQIWGLGLTAAELAALGLRLGADVPVFVHGRTSWAEGVGEELVPVEVPERWYLVLTPPVVVDTRSIYQAPELRRDCPRVTLEDHLAGRTANVCEPVTTARHPLVGAVLEWARAWGPARMSGTGASVFVAFAEPTLARQAQAKVPAAWASFVARGVDVSPLLAR